ncbi:hypothetical protein [Streptomyces sp. M54]|uniref:hypothetical protein n=1 Tax=Streptomyces sp. M54 TaxID=2759525 RepID=UPI001FB1199B|nr:hypothetical protein [Streptomyces sp. M54]
MLMRGQRTDLRIYRDVVRDHHVPQESATLLAPGPERFGLTIAPDGRHTPWLDTPDNLVPVRG